jgi:hypothetical protein
MNEDDSNQVQPQVPSTLRYEGQAPQAIEKPTSVMVFGILNIVFGALGLICTPFSILMILFAGRFAAMNQAPVMEYAPVYKMILLVSSVVGIGFSAWLLALGIGLVKMKGWGRRGSVIYSIIVIVWGIVGVALNILALHFGWMTVPEGGLPGYIGGMCGGVVGMVYPVLLLIFMSTSKVKRAFQD